MDYKKPILLIEDEDNHNSPVHYIKQTFKSIPILPSQAFIELEEIEELNQQAVDAGKAAAIVVLVAGTTVATGTLLGSGSGAFAVIIRYF